MRCKHGIRPPHECKECEAEIPDAEVKAFAKKMEREADERTLLHLEDVIERTYNHPDLSPWHVREALRLILEEIKELKDK